MKTLGKIWGGWLVAIGALMAARPYAYINFWDREGVPEWIRGQTRPWRYLPQSTLRLLGVDAAIIGSVMLGLSRRVCK